MINYAAEEYNDSRLWINEQVTKGFSWADVRNLCVSPDNAEAEFIRLRNDEMIIPDNMSFSQWSDLVAYEESRFSPFVANILGLSTADSNNLPVPLDSSSAWLSYKNYLLTHKGMTSDAVTNIEHYSHWILNRLSRDTHDSGPIKGLVMGSVQSGKTANMIGLATMAAHYDWNMVIILSGTIDNLRKQTRDRFLDDLETNKVLAWHMLDKASKPELMLDMHENIKCSSQKLLLNNYRNGTSDGMWLNRYITVCLKNSTRLTNLISWLHKNPARAAKLRILIIDDEADQASINTKKKDETDEEFKERTAVNQLIINLVHNRNADGSTSSAPFQAINYVSYTATPYANVLNEHGDSSLYPMSFICSLPESKAYFGASVIFGSKLNDDYSGLDIVRPIPKTELTHLKKIHAGTTNQLPAEFQKSLCWFLCSSAILRIKGHKKPISMLIHTTAIQNGQFQEYHLLKHWLKKGCQDGSILSQCETVYRLEKDRFTKEHLAEGYPDYEHLASVDGTFPEFDDISNELVLLLSSIENIWLDQNKKLTYHDDAIHLCVDNCSAQRIAEDGMFMRIAYPQKEDLDKLSKAPVFIVMGGNTLSRGLTIEGLVCTYFARESNQADTLMQMARWFGYRKGFELLQRVWMSPKAQEKFELMAEIDEKLKQEFNDFVEKGRSPGKFGPRIMSCSSIARFMLTSKNKSQSMVPCKFDFSGDSHENTIFDNNLQVLTHNQTLVKTFLSSLTAPHSPAADSRHSAVVWRNIPSTIVIEQFLKKYKLSNVASLAKDLPNFLSWMQEMNNNGDFCLWNVAFAGDQNAPAFWNDIAGVNIGKIERSKKPDKPYIDIGSLRSGRDALCDTIPDSLTADQLKLYQTAMSTRQNIISTRGKLNLTDTPLLLLYCIDKDRGQNKGNRRKLDAPVDLLSFAIIVPGDPSGKDHISEVTVRITE